MAGNKRWKQKEIDLIFKHYPTGGVEELKKELDSRSDAAIHKKASDLGVSFSPDERTDIKKMLTEILDRITVIEDHIKYGTKKIVWEKQHLEMLKELHPYTSDVHIAAKLGENFTHLSVRNKRLALGYKKSNKNNDREWDQKLIKEIAYLYQDHSQQKVIEKLNLNERKGQVYFTYMRNNDLLPNKKKKTTKLDDNLVMKIADLYPTHTKAEVIEMLGIEIVQGNSYFYHMKKNNLLPIKNSKNKK